MGTVIGDEMVGEGSAHATQRSCENDLVPVRGGQLPFRRFLMSHAIINYWNVGNKSNIETLETHYLIMFMHACVLYDTYHIHFASNHPFHSHQHKFSSSQTNLRLKYFFLNKFWKTNWKTNTGRPSWSCKIATRISNIQNSRGSLPPPTTTISIYQEACSYN